MNLLTFKDVSFGFSGQTVLENIEGGLGAGSYALEGANGSGKTTTLTTIAGITRPLRGDIEINECSLLSNPIKAKFFMSYMPDKAHVFPFMTGRDLLSMVAFFKRVKIGPQSIGMINSLNIEQYLEARFDMMSLGTQRKFTFVAALLGRPKVLLLDEPMNGLDQASIVIMSEHLIELSAESVILFSSHQNSLKDDLGAKVLAISHQKLLGI